MSGVTSDLSLFRDPLLRTLSFCLPNWKVALKINKSNFYQGAGYSLPLWLDSSLTPYSSIVPFGRRRLLGQVTQDRRQMAPPCLPNEEAGSAMPCWPDKSPERRNLSWHRVFSALCRRLTSTGEPGRKMLDDSWLSA